MGIAVIVSRQKRALVGFRMAEELRYLPIVQMPGFPTRVVLTMQSGHPYLMSIQEDRIGKIDTALCTSQGDRQTQSPCSPQLGPRPSEPVDYKATYLAFHEAKHVGVGL